MSIRSFAAFLSIAAITAFMLAVTSSCGGTEPVKAASTTYSLTGWVWHDTDNSGGDPEDGVDHAIVGVRVTLRATFPYPQQYYAYTDSNGLFYFDVPAGISGRLSAAFPPENDFTNYDPAYYDLVNVQASNNQLIFRGYTP